MTQLATATKKKQVEAYYLDRLRSAMTDFPSGWIEPTEEPDFLVHGEASVIGIELTELHRATPAGFRPPQAIEAMRHRVVARARALYLSKALPPVKVSIFMNDRHDIGKAAVEPLAEAICNLVSRNLPGPNSSREESFEWTKLAYFPECIHTIAIHRLDAITETFFSAPGSTWVSTLSDADVQRVIAPKELKYPTYRTKCGEVWLVINVDIGPMSTWFEYDALKITQPIRTPFQRVFVLRHFGGRLIELEVKR